MKIICILLLSTLLLCGCAEHPQYPTDQTESLSTLPTFVSEVTTADNTELPEILPTEPDPVFTVESGTHFERYHDELTSDYLDYYLFVPENADFNMPLVVFLHGDGEVLNPKNLENYGPIKAARGIYGEKYPFIALFPCTRLYSWVDNPIPQTLMGLINSVSDSLKIDKNRIILTGHSRGSSGVWNLLSTYGDYFSAAVPISCGPSTTIKYENLAKVPIRAFVGTIGEYEIKYGNAMARTVNKLLELNADAELIYLENQDHSNTSHAAFAKETFEWILSQ